MMIIMMIIIDSKEITISLNNCDNKNKFILL